MKVSVDVGKMVKKFEFGGVERKSKPKKFNVSVGLYTFLVSISVDFRSWWIIYRSKIFGFRFFCL